MLRRSFLVLATVAASVALGLNAWASPAAPSKIAFQSNREGRFQVYVMNADGGDVLRLTNSTGEK